MRSGILENYQDLLPLNERTPVYSLCEGSTPLVHLRNLSREMSIDLNVKFEGLNPTGSFKDRGMVLAVAKAVENGARALICASTGNTSASAAAYAAHAGLNCYVLLPSGFVAKGKLAQALIYGAKVISITGNFDKALELARDASREFGLAIVNSVNPYRLIGQRTASWEICDDLGKPPEWLVIPVGNAGNISAYYAGFLQYRSLGRIASIPRLMGIQAEGASPMVSREMIDHPETIATAIRIGKPVSYTKAVKAVRNTEGAFISVSDDEIMNAQKMLAQKDGIFAEPASCATIAGIWKLFLQGDLPSGISVTCILTGNGLKDPEAPMKYLPDPVEIEGDWMSLKEVLNK